MFKLALLSALVATSASALQMITPSSLVQCQPVLLKWNSGVAPFYPSVLPGNQPGATPLKTFPQTNADSLTWVVDLPAGTAVSLQIVDGTGAQQWASVLTIQEGSSSECLNGGSDSGAAENTAGGDAAGNTGAPAPAPATPNTATGAAPAPSASAATGAPAASSAGAAGAATASAGASAKPSASASADAHKTEASAGASTSKPASGAGAMRVGAGAVAAGVIAAMVF